MSNKAAKCKFQFHALSSSFKFYDGLLDTRKASCEIPMKEKKKKSLQILTAKENETNSEPMKEILSQHQQRENYIMVYKSTDPTKIRLKLVAQISISPSKQHSCNENLAIGPFP